MAAATVNSDFYWAYELSPQKTFCMSKMD